MPTPEDLQVTVRSYHPDDLEVIKRITVEAFSGVSSDEAAELVAGQTKGLPLATAIGIDPHPRDLGAIGVDVDLVVATPAHVSWLGAQRCSAQLGGDLHGDEAFTTGLEMIPLNRGQD